MPLIEASARGETVEFDRPAFAQIDRTWGRPTGDPDPLVSITKGPIRAFQPTAPGKEGEVEFYDHAQDPWEARNLAQPGPDGVRRLPEPIHAAVQEYLAMPPAAWGAPVDVELDEMELHQLKALGYVVQ
jgi:hypothetical protein